MDLSIHKCFDYRYCIGDAVDTGDEVIANSFDFYRHSVALRKLVVAAAAAAAWCRSIDSTDSNFSADRLARFVTCRYQLAPVVVVVAAAADFAIYLARFELLTKPANRCFVSAVVAGVVADDLIKLINDYESRHVGLYDARTIRHSLGLDDDVRKLETAPICFGCA
jgi:hypothetical protein